ncbi:hypothetical protein D9M71_115260 [compost metagenome]
MLGAIERLAVLVDEIAHVAGLFGGISENAHVGAGIAVQVVVFQVLACAEQGTAADFVAIDLIPLECKKLGLAVADAGLQGLELFRSQAFFIVRQPRADADLGQTFAQLGLAGVRGGESQHEVQVAEQGRAVTHTGLGFGPGNGRGSGCRLLADKSTEGLGLVTLLDLLDLGQVLLIEQLGAVQGIDNVTFAADDLIDTGRCLAFPVGAGNQVASAFVAGGAGAQVGEVLGIEVDQLGGIIAARFYGGEGQHQGLGTQVHPDKGVGRIGVRRDEGGVPGAEYLGTVADLVEWGLVVGATGVHGLGVQGLVHFHHGIAV